MKSLNDFINNQYITFDGLDETIIEKLANLKGQMINECDCGCCCGEPYPCDCPDGNTACVSCEPVSCPQTQLDPMETFKSKFTYMPKVYDLIDIHSHYDYKWRFTCEYQRSMDEPILLYDYGCLAPYNYASCDKLRNDVMTLCNDFDLKWPVIMFKSNGDIQVFGAKKLGSNGSERSIKSSLIEAANILTKLEKRKEINWAQVLDVSIDNLDDLYDFLFTVVLVKDKYDKEIEDKKAEEFKKTVTTLKLPVANTIG